MSDLRAADVLVLDPALLGSGPVEAEAVVETFGRATVNGHRLTFGSDSLLLLGADEAQVEAAIGFA